MNRSLVSPAVGLGGWTMLGRAHAQAGARPTTPRAPQPPSQAAGDPEAGGAGGNGLSDGEKAILALDDASVHAYNRGNSKSPAAIFTEEAEDDRYRGRDPIEKRPADTFAASRLRVPVQLAGVSLAELASSGGPESRGFPLAGLVG